MNSRRRPYDTWMTPIMPCLWFDGTAGAAVDHYLSIFPNSRRLSHSNFGPDTPGEEGSTMVVNFELDGNPFMALNGGPNLHLTPAVSFVITCETQAEIDHYWDRLLEGGEAMQCGWLTDRFGVSWQVVPSRLGELMGAGDVERANRVMQAVLRMVKFDIGELEAAAAG
jgi:predicted 3-demethylubiquinone-9 3-methyltransferase (glyoxalase superfamily)